MVEAAGKGEVGPSRILRREPEPPCRPFIPTVPQEGPSLRPQRSITGGSCCHCPLEQLRPLPFLLPPHPHAPTHSSAATPLAAITLNEKHIGSVGSQPGGAGEELLCLLVGDVNHCYDTRKLRARKGVCDGGEGCVE